MKWFKFGLWVGLTILGGFVGIPALVSSWRNPTAIFWVSLIGGALGVRVVYVECKKIGLFEEPKLQQPTPTRDEFARAMSRLDNVKPPAFTPPKDLFAGVFIPEPTRRKD